MDEQERLRYLKIVEQEDADRLRKIKLVQTKSESIKTERMHIEDENAMRQQRKFEQGEIEKDRIKKRAEDEAQ